MKYNCYKPLFTTLCLFGLLFVLNGCYSFKGISIAPEVKTYYVDQFQIRADNAPADIDDIFSEQLKQKINNNTRLTFNDESPDIEFAGNVISYSVDPVSPERDGSNTGSAFNRLDIKIAVEYLNNLEEEDSWNQTFSFFSDFESTENLSTVQEDLIEIIFDQILEDIFNKAFTNW